MPTGNLDKTAALTAAGGATLLLASHTVDRMVLQRKLNIIREKCNAPTMTPLGIQGIRTQRRPGARRADDYIIDQGNWSRWGRLNRRKFRGSNFFPTIGFVGGVSSAVYTVSDYYLSDEPIDIFGYKAKINDIKYINTVLSIPVSFIAEANSIFSTYASAVMKSTYIPYEDLHPAHPVCQAARQWANFNDNLVTKRHLVSNNLASGAEWFVHDGMSIRIMPNTETVPGSEVEQTRMPIIPERLASLKLSSQAQAKLTTAAVAGIAGDAAVVSMVQSVPSLARTVGSFAALETPLERSAVMAVGGSKGGALFMIVFGVFNIESTGAAHYEATTGKSSANVSFSERLEIGSDIFFDSINLPATIEECKRERTQECFQQFGFSLSVL